MFKRTSAFATGLRRMAVSLGLMSLLFLGNASAEGTATSQPAAVPQKVKPVSSADVNNATGHKPDASYLSNQTWGSPGPQIKQDQKNIQGVRCKTTQQQCAQQIVQACIQACQKKFPPPPGYSSICQVAGGITPTNSGAYGISVSGPSLCQQLTNCTQSCGN